MSLVTHLHRQIADRGHTIHSNNIFYNIYSNELKSEANLISWFVSYPINNYNVTLSIADYSHFKDIYTSNFTSCLQFLYCNIIEF